MGHVVYHLEGFNDAAVQAMRHAINASERFDHKYVGDEHLLFGILAETGGLAHSILDKCDIDVNKVRSAIEFIVDKNASSDVTSSEPTPRLKKIIELAREEAKSLGADNVSTEHLLLGIVREGEGIGAGILVAHGVILEEMRQGLYKAIASNEQVPPSSNYGMARLIAYYESPTTAALNKDRVDKLAESLMDFIEGEPENQES